LLSTLLSGAQALHEGAECSDRIGTRPLTITDRPAGLPCVTIATMTPPTHCEGGGPAPRGPESLDVLTLRQIEDRGLPIHKQ